MSVKRNIVANCVGQGVASLLSLALVPVYIGYLGIEAYALVGLFVVIQAWLGLLDLGMTPTLGREMARFTAGSVSIQAIRDLLRSLEIIYLGLAGVVAAVLLVAAGPLARHWLKVETLPIDTVVGALSMLAIVVALRFCEGIYRGGLMGLQQQVWVNVAGTLLALLRSLGALVILARVSPTIEAFFIWQGLVSLLTLAVLGVRLNTSLPPAPRPSRFSWAVLNDIRGFAGGVFGISLLNVVLQNVDKLLLSRLLPLTEFGYFMLATTVGSGLLLVSAPIVLAVGPMLVRLLETGNAPGLSLTYHKASQLAAVALAPAALVLSVFAQGVLLAWSGDAVLAERTAPILAVLAIGTFLNGLMQVPHQLQLAAGWTSLAMRIYLVTVAVMVPLLLWAVPVYGPVAAAAVWVCINIFYVLVQIPLMHRRLLPGELGRWYLFDVAMPVAAAAGVVAIAWLLRPDLAAGRLMWLGFLLGTGAAATIAAALAASTILPRLVAVMDRARLRLGRN
ncbi:MAG: lipopolysaccharide biosynthesis protein [Polymorphobacter sp.]